MASADTISTRKDMIAEAKLQLMLAGPIILVTMLVHGIQTVTVMFIGHLGVSELAAAALGYSFIFATGYSIMLGMSMALDTLCGQSFGAKQYHQVGIHMQRSVIVHLLTCIILTPLWVNSGLILKAVGQNSEIAYTAGVYVRYCIPAVYAYAFLHSLVRYLQMQSIVFPTILMSALTFGVHIFLCWMFIVKLAFGLRGGGFATSITVWLSVLLHSLYVKYSPSCKKTWNGLSKEAFSGFRLHLKVAVPAVLMVCLRLWTYEIIVLLACLLPNPKIQTSVLLITINVSVIYFLVSYGFSAAISIRVSNELGAGNPLIAKRAVFVVFSIYSVVGLALSMILAPAAMRRLIGKAYSNDAEVIAAVAAMMLILIASNFLEGVQGVLSGIVRGCGKQIIGAYCSLGAYYLVGLPAAVTLAFVFHKGAKGLWLGLVLATCVQCLSLLVLTSLTNFRKEADKAKERVQSFNVDSDIVKVLKGLEISDKHAAGEA